MKPFILHVYYVYHLVITFEKEYTVLKLGKEQKRVTQRFKKDQISSTEKKLNWDSLTWKNST